MAFDLSQAPWSLVMAIGSLGIVYLLYRWRPDVLERSGLRAREVALLCLGSLGGWAANVPLAIFGGTYLAVNVGGTIVAFVLIASWIRRKELNLVGSLAGTILVAIVAWKIVVFSPEEGIIARYPTFFLPVLAALAFALLVSVRNVTRSPPVAYTIGTLGALIGADLMHVNDMRAHFASAGSENTIISIGGAGVFDMVFLAGTFAMAIDLLLVVALASRRDATEAAPAKLDTYPGQPVVVEDATRYLRLFPRIDDPHGLDRALAGIAMSDQALRERDYARSVRMSWLAVDSLLRTRDVADHVANGVHPDLRRDLETLHAHYAGTRAADNATLQQAGEANVTAKTIIGALARKSPLRSSLPEVATA